jgi:hypothetical protein
VQAGVEGSIFIHASGFIGGHANKAGAIDMAIKVLYILLYYYGLLVIIILAQMSDSVFCF